MRLSALGGAFGGGAIAFTLMACYGCPASECAYDGSDGGRSLADAQVGGDEDDASAPDAGGEETDAGEADASLDADTDVDAGTDDDGGT